MDEYFQAKNGSLINKVAIVAVSVRADNVVVHLDHGRDIVVDWEDFEALSAALLHREPEPAE